MESDKFLPSAMMPILVVVGQKLPSHKGREGHWLSSLKAAGERASQAPRTLASYLPWWKVKQLTF